MRIGVDAEFMDPNSTADDAVLFGARAAVDDLNARGGVLGGRPLQLVTSDNRSVPARGVANLERLGAETLSEPLSRPRFRRPRRGDPGAHAAGGSGARDRGPAAAVSRAGAP